MTLEELETLLRLGAPLTFWSKGVQVPAIRGLATTVDVRIGEHLEVVAVGHAHANSGLLRIMGAGPLFGALLGAGTFDSLEDLRSYLTRSMLAKLDPRNMEARRVHSSRSL